MSDENYIDKLYKDSFQSFDIQPKKELNLKEYQKAIRSAKKKSLFKKIFSTKQGIGVSIAFIATLVAVFILFFNNKPVKQEEIKKEEIGVEQKIVEAPIVKADSAPTIETTPINAEIKKQIKTEQIEEDIKIQEQVKEPVVIRKTIIKRDTVIKHEKIIQKVPESNEK